MKNNTQQKNEDMNSFSRAVILFCRDTFKKFLYEEHHMENEFYAFEIQTEIITFENFQDLFRICEQCGGELKLTKDTFRFSLTKTNL